jgi:hypothetical protein
MTDEESVRFRQIAVLGIRRNVRGVAVEEARRQLQRISPYGSFQALPELAPGACERYPVPPTGEAALSYSGLPYDLLEDLLPQSGAWKQTLPFLMPREDAATGRPITPLHGGHVGLLCTAGLLNGVFGQGDDRHIARWRSVKYVTILRRILLLTSLSFHEVTPATNVHASFAMLIQVEWSSFSAIHSFIDLPPPELKYSPIPCRTSSSTRWAGSLATNFPFDETMAKSLPSIFNPFEPNPLPPPYTTLLSSTKAPTTREKVCAMSGSFLFIRAWSVRTLISFFFISASPEAGKCKGYIAG